MWLRIEADGTVTLICGKQEMGQGVRTSLPMILAGGVIWALSQLMAEITLKDGRVEQRTYGEYRIPTIADAPRIETHILGSDAAEAFGMGEPPVPPLVPAVLNAIFAATGTRHRRLPL